MTSSDELSSLMQEDDIPELYNDLNYNTGDIYRLLDNFEIIEPRKNNKMVPVENIDHSSTLMVTGKVKTHAQKSVCKGQEILILDDSLEEEEDYEIQDIPEQYTEEVTIGPLLEWQIECDKDEKYVWLKTQQAWYKLLNPSEKYSKSFDSAKNRVKLVGKIVDVLDEDTKNIVTLKEMSEKIPNFTEKDFETYVEFIILQLEQMGDEYLNTRFYLQLRNIAVESISNIPDDEETSPFASSTSKKAPIEIIEKFENSIPKEDCIDEENVSKVKVLLTTEGEEFRRLRNFTIFDANNIKCYVYRLKQSGPFYAFGDICYGDDDENDDDFDDEESDQIIKNVNIGKIIDWKIDYDSEPVRVWIKTKLCWYVLELASDDYYEYFDEVERAAVACAVSIPVILIDPLTIVASEIFRQIQQKFSSSYALNLFYADIPLIFEEIKKMEKWDDVKGTHFHVTCLGKTKGWSDPRKKKADQKKKAENRKKPTNSSHISTTPIVGKVFGQYWQLEDPENEDDSKNSFSIKNEPIYLNGNIELDENYLTKSKKSKKYYSQLTFGSNFIKLNDFVTIDPTTDKKLNGSKPLKKNLIFGIVLSIISSKNNIYCRIQRLITGKETFISDTVDPKELFLISKKGNYLASSIFSKPKFKASKQILNPELFEYYFRFCYDTSSHAFTFPPSYDIAQLPTLFDKQKPREIDTNTFIKERQGKKQYSSFQYAGETYSLGNFVYFQPKSDVEKTYRIGKIFQIITAGTKYEGVKIQIYERPWNVRKNAKDSSTNLKELFLTKEKTYVKLDFIDRKCNVYHKNNIKDFDEFEKLNDIYFYSKMYNKSTNSLVSVNDSNDPQIWMKPIFDELTGFDIFAGCGGLSTGLAMANIKTKWACERSISASKIFKENHKDCHMFSEDVNELLRRMLSENEEDKDDKLPKPGEVDVLCGGPPCQGFSGINRFQKFQDPLNMLFIPFLGLVEHLKPRFVIIENVAGMFRHSKGVIPKIVMSTFLALGYQINRKRTFFLASKYGEQLPEFRPAQTLNAKLFDQVDKNIPKLAKLVEKRFEFAPFPAIIGEDALSDLPKIENGECYNKETYDQNPKTPWQI
eukprot:gene2659-3855_t